MYIIYVEKYVKYKVIKGKIIFIDNESVSSFLFLE